MLPTPSPALSTSLSSPSLLARGSGLRIGLAARPILARIVGLDAMGDPTPDLEKA